MAYYKPEQLESFRKGLDWAKKNPTDPKSIEIQKRLKSGQLNFELRALGLKEVPVSVPKIVMPEAPKPAEMSQVRKPSDAGGDVVQTFQNLGGRVSETAQEIGEIAQDQDFNLAQKGMGVLGKLAGGVSDAIGDVVLGAGKLLLTQNAEDKVKEIVQGVAQGVAQTDTAKSLVDWYGSLDKNDKLIVDSAGGMAALIADVFSGGVVSKGVKEVAPLVKQGVESTLRTGKETGEVLIGKVEATADTVGDLFRTSQASLEGKVQSAFEKGVKPNLQGYKTLGEAEKYRSDIINAAKTIERNKGSLQFLDDAGQPIVGRTPESLQEFTEAIDQTKKLIYSQYDELATKAGENGVKIDTIKIANELEEVINSKALKLSNPEAVKYAKEVRNRFIQAGELDAKTAQDIIQNYNNSLKAFYRNPTPEGLTRNAVDALMANRMRQSLDEEIEGLTGARYQTLKNEYAALKTVERDVLRATLRDARKNTKGLIDYTDIFSGGQLVTGLLTLNPGMVTTGVAQKGIAEWFKYLNDPNRAIKNMFESTARLDQPAGMTPLPTRKQLEAPGEGAAQESIYTPINLGERSQSSIDLLERSNPNIKTPTQTSKMNDFFETTNAKLDAFKSGQSNPQGGYIMNPAIRGNQGGSSVKFNKIKRKGLDRLEEYVDWVNGNSKVTGDDLIQLKADAQMIADGLKLKGRTSGDKALGNSIGKFLTEYQNSKAFRDKMTD